MEKIASTETLQDVRWFKRAGILRRNRAEKSQQLSNTMSSSDSKQTDSKEETEKRMEKIDESQPIPELPIRQRSISASSSTDGSDEGLSKGQRHAGTLSIEPTRKLMLSSQDCSNNPATRGIINSVISNHDADWIFTWDDSNDYDRETANETSFTALRGGGRNQDAQQEAAEDMAANIASMYWICVSPRNTRSSKLY